MPRMRTLLVMVLLSLGCANKPSEEECKKAISNIQKVLGLEGTAIEADTIAAIRKCRGQSTRQAALCMAAAKTSEEIDACEKKK
jgi:hypothetical protein